MGTIDPSRRGCPSVLVLQKKKMLRPLFPRGYGVWIREKRILFALWKDTKVVCVASTVHSGHSCNQVKRRTKSSSGIQEQMVPIPRAIFDYNKKMGGVNL